MAIIGSCGHRVEELDDLINISTKEWEITQDGWVKAVAYKSVCKDCYQGYKSTNAIIENEAEELDWLTRKDD
jgi:hypothetical protein